MTDTGALHSKYAGDKNLVLVEGDHNSPRPRFLYDSAAIFLNATMNVPPALAIPDADAFNSGYPPWVYPGARSLSKSGRNTLIIAPWITQVDHDHHGLNIADLGFGGLNLDTARLGMTHDRQAYVQDTINHVFGNERTASSRLDGLGTV